MELHLAKYGAEWWQVMRTLGQEVRMMDDEMISKIVVFLHTLGFFQKYVEVSSHA
jgi:hypothetical protein